MTLEGLKAMLAKGQSPTLEIHAFEGVIYLVKIVTEVGETMLKKVDGDNQVFKSSTQAGMALADIGGTDAVIVHQCAYDEVIGQKPCQTEDPFLRTPMNLRLLAGLG
ncbi:MAG: DUF6482 family protein [Pseudomonadota bacterium]|nr:DUF6482 family protein [Pseudomonadota bacterium]